MPTTERFREWAALSAISAGLQRKCRLRINRQWQFANMYILLVGPPGSGKSVAIRAAREVVYESKIIRVTPTRLTPQSFYDEIDEAEKGMNLDNIWFVHCSLIAMIDEFGVFLRRQDLDFMADLADLYDCPNPFEYKTKHQGQIRAENAWFSFISGCTKVWVKEALTDTALDQGFPSRLILIYCDDTLKRGDLFSETELFENTVLKEDLIHDLKHMYKMVGTFNFTPDAAKFLNDWDSRNLEPKPLDSRFENYNSRRLAHITKLCMLFSASARDSMIITIEDVQAAKEQLLRTEIHMPKAIEALGANPLQATSQRAVRFIQTEYKRTGKAVMEHNLRQLVERDCQPQYVAQLIDSLVLGRRVTAIGKFPTRGFLPNGIGRIEDKIREKAERNQKSEGDVPLKASGKLGNP